MPTRLSRPKRPVVIFETPEFESASRRLLEPQMLRALHLLLADNPLAGEAAPGYPGLLELSFAKLRILYAVGKRLTRVYLLLIVEDDDPLPPPSSADGKLLRKVLDALLSSGVILAAREVLRELWELLRSLL